MTLMAKHRAEALRRLRNGKYELTSDGIVIPAMKLNIAGHWETQVGNAPWEIDPNIVTDQGMLHILGVALAQGSQASAFYIAPFGGNVTPASTWTAANFTSNSTEFTNYTETTRVLWAKDAAAANSIGNSTTPAVFTIGTGGGTVRGAGLVTVSAKSSTAGTLVAAARFSVDKAMSETEELRVKYIINATSS